MDEKEFTDVLNRPWWLLDLELKDDPLEGLRKELGERWGWDDPEGTPIDKRWYTKESNLKSVYESLSTSELMTQLDAMLEKERGEGGSVSVTDRRDWLEKVVKAKTPVEKPAAPGVDSTQAKVGQQPPVPPPTPAPQKEKVRLFGDKPDAAAAPKPAQPADAPKPGLFDKAKAAKATGPAQAAEAAGAAAGGPAPETPPPPPSAQEIMALADIPEAGIDKAELQELLKDPNFEAELAAAMAKLEAELAAAESEE